MEADVAAGKLDAFAERASRDHADGRSGSVKHHAAPDFWVAYDALPRQAQELANRALDRLKADPRHPSLHLKRVGRFWSARGGLSYRALGVDCADGILWFWIVTHAAYNQLIR